METIESVPSPAGLSAVLGDRFAGPSPQEVVDRLGKPDLAEVRALVSWRGAVAGPDVCHVSLALAYLDLLQCESCGRCTPCRIGIEMMRRALRRLRDGGGSEDDIAQLREFADQVEESAWCGVANTIREPILGLLEIGAEHFAAHATGVTCPPETTHGWVTAPCRSTCPSNVDCPWYIFQVAEEHPHLATSLVKEDNPLPATIGRTCHHPCEGNCTLAPIDEPIAINFLQRWAADREESLVPLSKEPVLGFPLGPVEDDGHPGALHESRPATPHEIAESRGTPDAIAVPEDRVGGVGVEPPMGEATRLAATTAAPLAEDGICRLAAVPRASRERVAIVGAGPAGLAAGYYLAQRGYRPVIFEALPVPGGMLWVGIPEYRLPKEVLRREVSLIEREGVEIRYGQAVGADVRFSAILDEFPASFLGIGAHSGKKLRIPGEDLPGSVDAIDFLRRVALGEPVELGRRVLVIGGGNSAMDAARTSLRLGAEEVTIVYRRAREQMPANPWEVEEAEEEGIRFKLLAAPTSCEGDVCVVGLVCQPQELGPPDASGRRSPVPLDCEPFALEADTVIAAVGQGPDFAPFVDGTGMRLNKWGYLECDPYTGMTTRPGIFVGGDAVSGGASVIEAIAAGKTAAKYIDRYLRREPVVEDIEDKTRRLAAYLGAQKSFYPLRTGGDYGRRQPMPMLPPQVRRSSFAHTELGFTSAQAKEEARRCLRCHRPLLVAYEG